MNETHKDTKRLFKNTLVLYTRMIVIMIITLYSSRIILQALGVDDYGLYNVVGGVVTMLGFLKTSLTSATQRFLSYEMGRNDTCKLKQVFSICLSTHFFISLFIVVLAETIGLWFLNTHIQIPEGREVAANWVYQYSVAALAISMITVPYHACTISHEKMAFFALVSILDAILKLCFALALVYTSKDKLILYAGLMMLTNVLNFVLYWIYDRKFFHETKYSWFWDKTMFREVFSFSGWTIVGQLAVVGSAQGKSILVNIFHSVTANAAMGIASQVNTAIVNLTSNFQMAFQPQLTKCYAARDYEYLNRLIIGTSKVSFFLLFIVSLPIMLNIKWLLKVWLTDVPEYSALFCNLFIIASILNALATPLWIAIFATGNIKKYQLTLFFAYCSELIFIYILFRSGFPPTSAMVVKVGLNFLMVFVRLYYTQQTVRNFSSINYLKKVLLPITMSSFLSIGVAYSLYYTKVVDTPQIYATIIVLFVSIFSSYFIGLTIGERKMIKNLIYKRIKNKNYGK